MAIKSLSQHIEKEIYQYVNIKWLLLAGNSQYCEIFKTTYFEEYLRTAASQNVLMKLRKIKIYS